MSALDETVRARLLRVARATLERELSSTGDCGADPEPWPELERCGVFVTLRTGGRLRGCIGTFDPDGDLPDTVERMTRAARSRSTWPSMPSPCLMLYASTRILTA